jgi:hypothetical protein
MLRVTVVPGDAISREAGRGQRDGSLARVGAAVGIAPDAVKLGSNCQRESLLRNMYVRKAKETHQLAIAHHSHDAERLHADAVRHEGRTGTLIAEHDVRVDVRIQVRDSVPLDGILKGRLALARRVIGALAGAVVGAVTVDVHVGELVGPAQVDKIVTLIVGAVREAR